MTKEVQNAAMYTLFYLCRVNHPRQIIAVEHEIIPVLIKVLSCMFVKSLSRALLDVFVCIFPLAIAVWRWRVEAAGFAHPV